MSYQNRVSGQIRIHPPLTWGEIRDSPFSDVELSRSGSRVTDLAFTIEKEVEETEDGTLARRRAVGIETRSAEPGNFYDMKAELEEIAQQFAAPGRTFTGWLEFQGDPGFGELDVRRYGIEEVAGRMDVVQQEATLVWPDGETVERS